MFNNKTVRSALLLCALSGMLAACSSNSGNTAPLAPAAKSADGTTILSQEVTQKSSVKIASVTDAEGRAVATTSSGALAKLGMVTTAVVTKEAIQQEGAVVERMLIDLAGAEGTVLKFYGNAEMGALTLGSEFPATGAEVSMVAGKIASMLIHVEDGSVFNVVLAFGDEKQDQAKQDQAKQDQAKQDQAKQDQAKQDQAKQDTAKQDEAKQDQTKQDTAKQDEAKQDQTKQDTAKQDEAKQDTAKQDEAKQDQTKQDTAKQDEAKQDQTKQDTAKQDEAKQDEPKQDQAKQDTAKQDEPKQDTAKQDQTKK